MSLSHLLCVSSNYTVNYKSMLDLSVFLAEGCVMVNHGLIWSRVRNGQECMSHVARGGSEGERQGRKARETEREREREIIRAVLLKLSHLKDHQFICNL